MGFVSPTPRVAGFEPCYPSLRIEEYSATSCPLGAVDKVSILFFPIIKIQEPLKEVLTNEVISCTITLTRANVIV